MARDREISESVVLDPKKGNARAKKLEAIYFWSSRALKDFATGRT